MIVYIRYTFYTSYIWKNNFSFKGCEGKMWYLAFHPPQKNPQKQNKEKPTKQEKKNHKNQKPKNQKNTALYTAQHRKNLSLLWSWHILIMSISMGGLWADDSTCLWMYRKETTQMSPHVNHESELTAISQQASIASSANIP